MTGVLITSRVITQADLERIAAGAPRERIECARAITPQALSAVLESHPASDVVLADELPSSLAATSSVRWIQTTSAGVDHLRSSPLWNCRDLAITNASGLSAVAMAQYAMAYILRFAHNLGPYETVARAPQWHGRADVRRPLVLFGRTLGIIGYGGVGRRVAHVAKSFGLRVIAVRNTMGSDVTDRFRLPFVERIDGDEEPAEVWPRDRLQELLGEVDYLVVAAALTAQSERMIGGAELALMKPTSYLINISRGRLIDEPAVAEALNADRIAGAALDVFSTEPPDPESPLLQAKNVIVTPHVSGAYEGVGQFTALLFLANLERYRAGQPLLNRVDRERGY